MPTPVYWIESLPKGRLGISSRPRGNDWLGDELSAWKNTGVGGVVSLLTADEENALGLQREASLARGMGLKFFSLPIPDYATPTSDSEVAGLVEGIEAELVAGQSVVIHCRQGIGRSGMIASAVLISLGMDLETAIEAVSRARGLKVPETSDQRRWISHFADASSALKPR